MYVYVDGKILRAKDAVISVFDHGFLYGDGIYETLRVYDGVVFNLDEHLKRLFRSASLIGLSIPLDINHLKIAIYETLIANALRNAYVRLTISRGKGAVGLDPDLCPEPTIVIFTQDFKAYPKEYYKNGLHLIIPETRRNHRKAVNPQIKSLNFLNNILAKVEAKKANAHEAIMLNVYGNLTEGTISNIFFFKNRELCTPSIECGILDGITRGMIIDLAMRESIQVHEGRFREKDIYSAEEVFITNTSMEVMPVSKVDNQRFAVGNVAKFLRRIYQQEVEAYIAEAKAKGPSLWAENE
jgi:branched-chain amino acid aminotransferase